MQPQLFGIMLGQWEWHLVRGDLRPCVGLAADGMALAERLNDPGMLMEALFMPGATMLYRAQFAGGPRLLREGGGRLRRPRAYQVLGRPYGPQRRRDPPLLSRAGPVAPRLSRTRP